MSKRGLDTTSGRVSAREEKIIPASSPSLVVVEDSVGLITKSVVDVTVLTSFVSAPDSPEMVNEGVMMVVGVV